MPITTKPYTALALLSGTFLLFAPPAQAENINDLMKPALSSTYDTCGPAIMKLHAAAIESSNEAWDSLMKVVDKNQNQYCRSFALSVMDYLDRFPQKAEKACDKAIALMATDPQSEVRSTAAYSLRYCAQPRTLSELRKALTGTDSTIKRSAALAVSWLANFSKLTDPALVDPLIAMLETGAAGSDSAADALGYYGDRKAVMPLIRALGHSEWGVRIAAATALGQLKDPQAIEPLSALLGDPREIVRNRAADALAVLGVSPDAALKAGNPRTALTRMVAALRSLSEDALFNKMSQQMEERKKIIETARSLQPPPAPSEAAEKAMARGRVTLRNATSRADYADAVKEFQKAVNEAPWWADAYFNLATALEKVEDFKEAVAGFNLYLAGAAQDQDVKAVREHLYELEVLQEKADKKAMRIAHAQSFLDWFKTNYGSNRIRSGALCLPAHRGGQPFCTDSEAQQSNWQKTGPGSSEDTSAAAWQRANQFMRFELEGEEIKLYSPAFELVFCGKIPDSNQPAEMEWRICSSNAPAKILFITANRDNRPGLEFRWACKGSGDDCMRFQFILE